MAHVWSVILEDTHAHILPSAAYRLNLLSFALALYADSSYSLRRATIPGGLSSRYQAFAFVEFRREDDAEDAYYDMYVRPSCQLAFPELTFRHGRMIDGRRITVQWAKRPPSAAWRHDG